MKAYISSQYSSRMVLLSLLLATEMSVFFNSSPELVNLRNQLSVIDSKNSHDGNGMRTLLAKVFIGTICNNIITEAGCLFVIFILIMVFTIRGRTHF